MTSLSFLLFLLLASFPAMASTLVCRGTHVKYVRDYQDYGMRPYPGMFLGEELVEVDGKEFGRARFFQDAPGEGSLIAWEIRLNNIRNLVTEGDHMSVERREYDADFLARYTANDARPDVADSVHCKEESFLVP